MRMCRIAKVNIDGIQHEQLLVCRGSQACLLQDASNRWQRQVFFWMRHCHLARLGGVFELVVRAHHMHQIPAICLDLLDEGSAFHLEFYTRIHNNLLI